MDIYDNINQGKYKVTPETSAEQQAAIFKLFKEDALNYCNISDHPKANAAFEMAWHPNACHKEVVNYLHDLAFLMVVDKNMQPVTSLAEEEDFEDPRPEWVQKIANSIGLDECDFAYNEQSETHNYLIVDQDSGEYHTVNTLQEFENELQDNEAHIGDISSAYVFFNRNGKQIDFDIRFQFVFV